MTRLFIVRHGNTFDDANPPRRIGRGTDLPLAESGRAQAAALGRWFADHAVAFRQALAGSLKRTRDTAKIILSHAADPIEPQTADWLTEIDHGPDEGLPDTAVAARIGATALKAWEEEAVAPPGWDVDAAGRLAAWHMLLDAPPIGDTLLVTSSGAARFALLARPELRSDVSLKLRTGSFGQLDIGPQGTAELVRWNVRP